ncbi:MAG: site-specific DNA-methyltransferase [Patescibacteria group bacterium]|jgi:DNA modification methylase
MNTSPATTPKESNNPSDGLWRLGSHRLLRGDATKKADVDRLINGDKVTLLLTDPPYGVGYVEGKQEFLKTIHRGNKSKKFTAIQGDGVGDDYYDFSRKWLETVRPHFKDKNAFYIFNGDAKLREFLNALHDTGYTKSALLIWLKNHLVVGRKDFHPQHELIAYGWYGRHAFFGNKDRTTLFYPKPSSSKLHPTMKPPALLRRLIYHSTKPGDIVLDLFGGSGSTLIACEQLGRRCFMMECDTSYCATIVERWQKLTKGKA